MVQTGRNSMNDDKKNEEAIFKSAIEIDSVEERAAFVKSACGEDAELLRRVEGLLKFHYDDNRFLASPPACEDITLDTSPLTEGPGTKIGRYKLLQRIGEGGFGVVYMAEQERPIRRRVALKIIKLGMDTKQVIARFEAERQALAMMEHPNIARVFDGGATDTGRPYFVMELVKGMPITEYCDQNNLDTQQRLELFVDICKAVQHAHQKGIIHRDIKPSNVMITLHDGKPVPKIIDFGIAKATAHRLTEKTLFTEYQQFIGTPEYMSPEQAEMSGLDVDTRSDIYSLGVLLYELLTGTTPFEAEKLRSAAYDEIRRIIREDEPPKPSTRLSTLGDTLAEIARHRHVQPGELRRIVRGDLDWIVMKSLEKDRTRRYETANELAQDIHRHLSDEPVLASPPSRAYRLRKYVRRHRNLVITGLLTVSALTIGLVLATIGFIQASHQRNIATVQYQRAQASFQYARGAVDELTQTAISLLTNASDYKHVRREMLHTAQSFYQSFLKDEGSSDPEVRYNIAWAYFQIGNIRRLLNENEDAQTSYHTASKLFWELIREYPDATDYWLPLIGSSAENAQMLRIQEQFAEAEDYSKKMIKAFEQFAVKNPDIPMPKLGQGFFYHQLGDITYDQGQREIAEEHYRQAVNVTRELIADYPDLPGAYQEFAYCSMRLSSVLEDKEKSEEITNSLISTFEERTIKFPGNPEERFILANSYANLGDIHAGRGNLEKTEQAYKQVNHHLEKLAAEHPELPLYLVERYRDIQIANTRNLSVVLMQLGKLQEAEPFLNRNVNLLNECIEQSPQSADLKMELACTFYFLGNMQADQGNLEKAEQAYKQANRHIEKLAAEHPELPLYLVERYRDIQIRNNQNLSSVLFRLGKFQEAEQFINRNVILLNESIEQSPQSADLKMELASTFCILGDMRADQGNLEKAEQAYKQANDHIEKMTAEHPELPLYLVERCRDIQNRNNQNLSSVLFRLGKFQEAEQFLNRNVNLLNESLEQSPKSADLRSESALTFHYLGDLLRNTGRYKEAEDAYRKSCSINAQLSSEFPDNPTYRRHQACSYRNMGGMLNDVGQINTARQDLQKAAELFDKLVVDFPDNIGFKQEAVEVYRELGGLLNSLGQTEQAKEIFRRADIIEQETVSEE